MWDFMRHPDLGGPKVVILDFGSNSLKTAFVQIDLNRRFGYVSAFTRSHYEFPEISQDQLPDSEELLELAYSSLEKNFKSAKDKTKEALFVLNGSLIRAEFYSWSAKRKHPEARLDEAEFQDLLVSNLKDYKKDLASREKSGLYHIINGMLQQVKIDGYVISNPLGFKGQNIQLMNFLFLLKEQERKFWLDISSGLKLSLHTIIPSIWATMRSQMRHTIHGYEGIFMDVGGNSTDILLVRDSIVESMKTINSGGRVFTKAISEIFEIDEEEALQMQLKYERGSLDDSAVKKIDSGLKDHVFAFREQIIRSLQDLGGNADLPSKIYLVGGGMKFGLLPRTLMETNWPDYLPFNGNPQIEVLLANEITDVVDLTKELNGPEFVPLLASARWISRHYRILAKAENFFEGAIKLMQD